jgi:hypothetical protein
MFCWIAAKQAMPAYARHGAQGQIKHSPPLKEEFADLIE